MKTDYIYGVVTGAGKGLGKSIAIELARRRKNLILMAKEGEGLIDFANSLESKFNIKAEAYELNFLHERTISKVKEILEDKRIDVLVNNAGIGGSMYFEQSNVEQIDSIIQINIRMLVFLTRILTAKLKEFRSSYVLNIASMASCCPIAYKTIYPASKAFVHSFSMSLAEELKQYGVHVCVMLPGPIKTNREVSQRIEKQGWWVKAGLQTPEKLASIAIESMYRHKTVVVPGIITKINWLLLKILPKSVCIPLISHAVKNEINEVAQLASVGC